MKMKMDEKTASTKHVCKDQHTTRHVFMKSVLEQEPEEETGTKPSPLCFRSHLVLFFPLPLCPPLPLCFSLHPHNLIQALCEHSHLIKKKHNFLVKWINRYVSFSFSYCNKATRQHFVLFSSPVVSNIYICSGFM